MTSQYYFAILDIVPFLFFYFLFIPMTKPQELIMGIWKFSDKIPVQDIVKLAQNWAEEDKSYLQLYVRKVSKDQHGIGFTYDAKGQKDLKKFHEEYIYKVSDVLRRQFGNDLAGWDIASNPHIIK